MSECIWDRLSYTVQACLELTILTCWAFLESTAASQGCLLPWVHGWLNSGSLICDCSLFSGSYVSSVLNTVPFQHGAQPVPSGFYRGAKWNSSPWMTHPRGVIVSEKPAIEFEAFEEFVGGTASLFHQGHKVYPSHRLLPISPLPAERRQVPGWAGLLPFFSVPPTGLSLLCEALKCFLSSSLCNRAHIFFS